MRSIAVSRSGAETQGAGAASSRVSRMSQASNPAVGRGPSSWMPTQTTPAAAGGTSGSLRSATNSPAPPSSIRSAIARVTEVLRPSGGPLGQLRLQLAAQELAGVVVRQGVAEFPDLRRFGRSQPVLHPSRQVLRRRAAIPGDDYGGDGLAPLLVGDAQDRDVLHLRVGAQHVLDLAGAHVLAPAHDHVVEPAFQEEIALVVQEAAVVGGE